MELGFNYGDLLLNVWKHYKEQNMPNGYWTILAWNGVARYGKIAKNQELVNEIKELLTPFVNGEVEKCFGAYGTTVYRFGGNASAFLLRRDYWPEIKDVMVKSAEMLCNEQSRNDNKVFDMPHLPGLVWIDSVFGVCPFLLWVGQVADREEFIEESIFQMLKHHELLYDPELKLYKQAYKPGKGLTPAHWSRGVGWGLFALAEMLFDLPKTHDKYNELLTAFRDVMDGCLASQDECGLWHQAMEDKGSFIETSGSALILYAISRGLKNGSIATEKYDAFYDAYIKGMRGLMRYIAIDGSIFNTSVGCLAPGYNGTVADYAMHQHKLDDPHAAGTVIMALSQAQLLYNIKKIPTLQEIMQ